MIRDCYSAECGAVSPGDYFDWRSQTHAFEDMASWQWWGFNLSGEHGELPEAVTAAGGTGNLFFYTRRTASIWTSIYRSGRQFEWRYSNAHLEPLQASFRW